MSLKLIITGHAGHGKDTACEYLKDTYKLNFESSSRILLKEVIYPALKDKYGYESPEQCYVDRIFHRSEWFNLLAAYNNPDLTRLARIIFDKYDIYCGLRNAKELAAIKRAGLVDYVVWIDSSYRVPFESRESMTISKLDCDYVVKNNTDLETLYFNLDEMMATLTKSLIRGRNVPE